MPNEEVKPSFSLKYLLLTALTAAIVGGVGWAASKLVELRPTKELSVANGYSINVIDRNLLSQDKFEVEYYLKGEEMKKISSLFRKKVIIKNTGNEGVTDLKITAILKTNGLELIEEPRIETFPKSIVDAIIFTKSKESNSKKHIWNVSLLNPGESISLDYTIFSTEEHDKFSFEIIPRKKDWVVNYKELRFSQEISFTGFILPGSLYLVILSIIPFILAFPIYRYQWNRRSDFRAQYSNFRKFYNNHRPWDLFTPQKIHTDEPKEKDSQ